MTAVAVVVGGLLAASGCSSDGGSGETPDGFVRAAGKQVSVAHPKDWQKGPDQTLPVSLQAPGQSALLQVVENVSANGSADMLESVVEAGPRLQAKEYGQTGKKSIKVAGAEAALRIDYTFSDFRGAGLPGQGVDVGLLGKDEHVHIFRLNWERGKLPSKTVDDILSSIKLS